MCVCLSLTHTHTYTHISISEVYIKLPVVYICARALVCVRWPHALLQGFEQEGAQKAWGQGSRGQMGGGNEGEPHYW